MRQKHQMNLLGGATAPPAPPFSTPMHMAHQLTWNRTCNVSGGEGNNTPLDLMVEHFNRVVKEDLNIFRSNIGEKSVSRSSQAIIEKIDSLIKMKKPSGCHNIILLVQEIKEILKSS